jgi:hypothetical protein
LAVPSTLRPVTRAARRSRQRSGCRWPRRSARRLRGRPGSTLWAAMLKSREHRLRGRPDRRPVGPQAARRGRPCRARLPAAWTRVESMEPGRHRGRLAERSKTAPSWATRGWATLRSQGSPAERSRARRPVLEEAWSRR